MNGKITHISPYGFKLDNQDQWYNYDKKGFKSTKLTDEDKGKKVILTLNPAGFVRNIEFSGKLTTENAIKPLEVNNFDNRTKDIHKQVSLKIAFGFVQIDSHTPLDVIKEKESYCFELAKKIERYLNE
jgi:hypothetical protein